MSPIRVQRRRTEGWRMPENTVYVGRGGGWGNPFRVGGWFVTVGGYPQTTKFPKNHPYATQVVDNRHAVELYRQWLGHDHIYTATFQRVLAGWNLACWCPLDKPCHADVLLELANR